MVFHSSSRVVVGGPALIILLKGPVLARYATASSAETLCSFFEKQVETKDSPPVPPPEEGAMRSPSPRKEQLLPSLGRPSQGCFHSFLGFLAVT
ncbi:hypothetical protein PO909_006585 [Leuciscus waleckii]